MWGWFSNRWFSPWYVEEDPSCTSLYFFLTLKILKLQSDSYWGWEVGDNWFRNYTRSFYDSMLPSPESEFVNVQGAQESISRNRSAGLCS
jgi:hypothetical protein